MLDVTVSPILQMSILSYHVVPKVASSNSDRLDPGFKSTLPVPSPRPKGKVLSGLCLAWNFLLTKDCGCLCPRPP